MAIWIFYQSSQIPSIHLNRPTMKLHTKICSLLLPWLSVATANDGLSSGYHQHLRSIAIDSPQSHGFAPLDDLGESRDLASAEHYHRNLVAAKVGNKTLVAIRVETADSASSLTALELEDTVFGSYGDVHNVVSQQAACSFGQLRMNKLTGYDSLLGGTSTYTVVLPDTNVAGLDSNDLLKLVLAKAEEDFGLERLKYLADYVMMTMPPGTNGNWLAYAGEWLSVYNDRVIEQLGFQMHEVGHSLGLRHSGEDGNPYNDRSGYMGIGSGESDKPQMCYNGPKTYQLGWFSEYHHELDDSTGFEWAGNLVGFVDRDNADAAADKMIIRIHCAVEENDIYVSYNRATGFNHESKEGRDQVLVTTREFRDKPALSWLLAKLSPGGVHVVDNYCGTSDPLSIKVDDIDETATPWRAAVSIHFGPCGGQGTSCDLGAAEDSCCVATPCGLNNNNVQLCRAPSEPLECLPELSNCDATSGCCDNLQCSANNNGVLKCKDCLGYLSDCGDNQSGCCSEYQCLPNANGVLKCKVPEEEATCLAETDKCGANVLAENAHLDCCDGLDCAPAPNGVLKCTSCMPTGSNCEGDEGGCCGGLECIPNNNGVLKCLEPAQEPTCMEEYTKCADDPNGCCDGLQCIPGGNGVLKCRI